MPQYNTAFLDTRGDGPYLAGHLHRKPTQKYLERSRAIRVCGIIYSLYRTISRAAETFLSLPFLCLSPTPGCCVTSTSRMTQKQG